MSLKYLPSPNKSKSDKKEYRTIELPNKLVVLIVSDPGSYQAFISLIITKIYLSHIETEKSAASLSVKVGYLEDPEDVYLF